MQSKKIQAYLLNRPLGDIRYTYEYDQCLVLLMPKHKICFVNFGEDQERFSEFCDDFIEDLGSIADKFRYRESIGRPRSWADLFDRKNSWPNGTEAATSTAIEELYIEDPARQRVCELLISLLTGSINDIERIGNSIPDTTLDKVKRKILLFDGDQTRFIYEHLDKTPIRIQGLSGTGKTELLLHKIKELYIENQETKIAFTCHNRILAHALRRRIPDFFNFMKVEQQILWEERLWCMHAWGSSANQNSGTYRYICAHYEIPFETYGQTASFDDSCKRALERIKALPDTERPFDYLLIDESQDFEESFFELCSAATKKTVFIAGDIFQSIFAESIQTSIEPDYLLSKCYRTDPRTLMFAHALGMGLFEPEKLWWLEDDEWKACGYIVEKRGHPSTYHLSREPLRRFEDIDRNEFKSVELIKTSGDFFSSAHDEVIEIIKNIISQNPTATPDDIGVIILDKGNSVYALADRLEQSLPRVFGWNVNKAYETKRREKGFLFVSNRNNVKGLEFPFVICVTKKILNAPGYRNALYMTLTRSFIQTYLVTSESDNSALLPYIEKGLSDINTNGHIRTIEPPDGTKEAIRTKIKHSDTSMSFFDFLANIFDELEIHPVYRERLQTIVTAVTGEEFNYGRIREIVEVNFEQLQKTEK